MVKIDAQTQGDRMSEVKIGFEMRKVHLLLENILPVRQIKDPQKTAARYKTILVSLKEVGLVEPLVVHPQKDVPEKFLLLNGHLRYFALKELGEKSADCIISNDDECYTYNSRVSRLAAIQEHRMITKAVNNGANWFTTSQSFSSTSAKSISRTISAPMLPSLRRHSTAMPSASIR
jgi:hypothetical protein